MEGEREREGKRGKETTGKRGDGEHILLLRPETTGKREEGGNIPHTSYLGQREKKGRKKGKEMERDGKRPDGGGWEDTSYLLAPKERDRERGTGKRGNKREREGKRGKETREGILLLLQLNYLIPPNS
jgi:hypothetical protein